jgi:exosortase
LRIIYLNDVDESLGMYVPVVVLALFWWKRQELSALEKHVWWPALGLFALALLLHIVGYVIQQARVSLVAFALGFYSLTGLLWGYRWMRATFFPVFLLIFAVPMSTNVEQFTLPLRELATKITVVLSRVLGINVIQEGTLMFDSAHRFQYNVEAACSGLRSLTTMLALSCVFAFTSLRRNWKRAVLILSALPFAVVGNVLRLLTIIIAAEAAGQEAGNYVHKHWLFSLIPYVPAMIGMSFLARWLREGLGKGRKA